MRRHSKSTSLFTRLAKATSRLTGHPVTFGAAAALIILWAASGPLFGFSDTWQLIVNTSTTIVTFLTVFLIQNSQSRDSEAIQVKLDELIRSIDGAHLALLDLEELPDEDLQRICRDYRDLAKRARRDLAAGKSDTDVREVGLAVRRDSDARKKK